jgi:hypothetical protein
VARVVRAKGLPTDTGGFEAEFLNDVKIYHVKKGEIFEIS